MKTFAVLLAGGQGTRMNSSVNKILLPLLGKKIITRSAEAFSGLIDEMAVVVRSEEKDIVQKELSSCGLPFCLHYVSGGTTRQKSVLNGLRSLKTNPDDIILIHDAARCLVDRNLISRIIDTVKTEGSCIPGISAVSTFKLCDSDQFVLYTPERRNLYEIQTPQGFWAGIIIPVAEKADHSGVEGTDDAFLLELEKIPVKVIQGSEDNIKITEARDIRKAELILKGEFPLIRTGLGYDVHCLTAGRRLVLCGIEIPFEKGLLGHSDADVALHALMDAMLGACALGDIGKHFPDTSPEYSGISSLLLLEKTNRIIRDAGYYLNNADITIVAQKPRILPYIQQMRETVSNALEIDVNQISIKATTTERLGFEGRMEGISSYAICTVIQK